MPNDRNGFSHLRDLCKRLGKKRRLITRIDAPGIGSGDFPEQEENSVLNNGVVETQVTTHNFLLDCDHIKTASSVEGLCYLCGSLCCESCLVECPECFLLTCRSCLRKSVGTDGSIRNICRICSAKQDRRRVAQAVAGFFVKR